MSDADEPGSGLFQDAQSVAEAKKQLSAWITPGTTIADAVRKLKSQGFTCGAAMPPSTTVQSSVYCGYQAPPPPPPDQRVVTPRASANWTVTLESKDGNTVSAFQASRLPPHLGE